MKKLFTFLSIALVGITITIASAADVSLTLKPEQELNRIDEKIYSHFLEHIYHSVNGGLWGDLVWNRTFEDHNASGWSVEDGVMVQKSNGEDRRTVFGEADWSDYEFTLEAQKTGGAEGFLILFRTQSNRQFSWVNLGGWQNRQHGIERRGAGQNRQSGVGQIVNGSIERNKWYSIKVRCEGNNVKVSLDGEQIIDVTDPNMAKTGRVGIGTWNTQAKFRNLKVTSLDGKNVLYNEVPKVSQDINLRHWKSSGADGGTVTLNSTDALNGKTSVQMTSTGSGTASLEQAGLVLKKGETYILSCWAKKISGNDGRKPSLLMVVGHSPSLIAHGDFVTHGNYTVTSEWTRYTSEFTPNYDMVGVLLRFVVIPENTTVLIDQVSIMPKSWAANGGFRPDLLQAIADIKPPLIRWPGGCFASAYRWKDGIGPQEKREVYPFSIWDDREVNSYGTDEFLTMCKRVGSEPLIVINTGTPGWNVRRTPETANVDWIQEASDWLEYCNGSAETKWGKVRAENGHPEPYNVKYWEIDNEIESSVNVYIANVKKFVPALKKIDPSIKIIACGSWRGNRAQWDDTLVKEVGSIIDYISFHQYDNPNLFADGPGRLEEYFTRLGKVIAESPHKHIKIFDSEWNAQSTDWRTGLYCGGILNVFERCGDVVEIAAPALFLRHNTATAWDNAFINFDNKSWYPAPNYVVMKLWREHYAPTRIGLDGDVQKLNVVATKSEDGKTFYVKAVNPTEEVQNVTLNVGADAKSASFKLVTASALNARNTLANPNAIAPKDAEAKVDGKTVQFVLPAYSAGVVTVK